MNRSQRYPKTAIIIVSYNACKMMQENIYSIRKTVEKGSYHIYVVDNNSTDGIGKWLLDEEKKSDDLSVLINTENVGFPKGCNQGVALSESLGDNESDIFLLNNDTRLCENSLKNLKEALYSSDDIGATGSISNYVGNKQQIAAPCKNAEEFVEFGNKQNVPYSDDDKSEVCEERVRLSGFAMLIKREVWNKAVGMDEMFSPGYFEDDDLSMKILLQGKRILLCLNSFIYHAGSQSFSKVKELNSILENHYQMFGNKYGFPIVEYAYPDEYTLDEFRFEKNKEYNFLHVGCGIGAGIKYINSKYNNVHTYGVEYDERMRKIVSPTEKVYLSIEEFVEQNKGIIIDAVYINNDLLDSLSEEEYSKLKSVSYDNTMLNVKSSVDYSKLKLIVWEPGKIFWNIDSEKGNVILNDQKIQLVRSLTDRGIVSSISSTGDGKLEAFIFEKVGILDFTAFNDFAVNSITESIEKKMQCMDVKASEVMYINDNVETLIHIDEMIKDINASDSGVIPELLDYVSNHQETDCERVSLSKAKALEERFYNS